jgi:hypothetical protein
VIVSFFRVIYSLIFLIGVNLYSAQVLALELKGATIYQDLGKDYYIASLYVTDSSQDTLILLADDKGQQMKIKVVAKRWSARKWKAQWQNNIAINNLIDTDAKLAKAIVRFTEFPLNSLREGDEIIIDYVPNIGTSIYFNSHQVVTTNNVKLYSYLLNTWLGKFSPNRIFKENITGIRTPEVALLVRADKVINPHRVIEVSTWFVSDEEKRKAKKQQALLVAEELKKRNQDDINERKALARKKSEQDAKQKGIVLAQQRKNEEQKRKSDANSLEKQKKNTHVKKQQALAEKNKKQQYDLAMQDYYHQLYLWQLQGKINESVVYPPWARQFSQQGPVELTFSTDRSATLLNLVNKTADTSKILVQEVERRLYLALEAIPRPSLLKGDRWDFSISYVFSPAVKEMEPLPMPKKP